VRRRGARPPREFFFREGCWIAEIWNSARDATLSIARARVEPGVITRWHRLTGIGERYLIISGRGRVEVGRLKPRLVRTGDVVLVTPGMRQRIANTGRDDLIFLAICTPRFRPSAYEDLEGG
jgi:mannose-6-phosphate isomerase-like protein (cupin superfamily)